MTAADEIRPSRLRRVSLNPLSIIVALALGILTGVTLPVVAPALGYASKIYLLVLNMCVAPILVALLTTSVGRLTGLPTLSQFLARVAIVFPVVMVAVSAIAVVAGIAFGPGRALDHHTRAALGIVVNGVSSELRIPLNGALTSTQGVSVLDVVGKVIPENIFEALDRGNSLQIVFAAILFGAALGFLRLKAKETVFDFMDGLYAGFRAILDNALMLLPFAVFCIAASESAKLNVTSAIAMSRFIGESIVLMLAIGLAGSVIIAYRSHASLLKVLDRQRSVLILALTSRNSFACMPSAVTSLKSLGFDAESCEMLVPLAITLCRVGSIAYFAFAAMFVIQLYDTPFSTMNVILVVTTAVLAGVATAGVTGVLQLSFIGMVLSAVGVPFEAALILFIAVDSLVDPFRTLVTVNLGVTIASLVGKSTGGESVAATDAVGTLGEPSPQPA